MSTPFGPQLIGETEKTLSALLRRILEPWGLTEPQWVTLRLAGQLGGSVDADGLVDELADRAHFSNAADLVGELTAHGLLEGGALSSSGKDLTVTIQATLAERTAPIWAGLSESDVASTSLVLNEVIDRARRALSAAA